MALIINAQSFVSSASGLVDASSLAATFHEGMDAVLIGMGRNITLHLPPSRMPCTSSDCIFNSFYKRYMNSSGKVCDTCKGDGSILEPRQTLYLANIRWTNEPFNNSTFIEENQPGGRIGADFVRTKTVLSSWDDLRKSIGATIDGVNVELFQEPRQTGFAGQLFYVVAWWKVVNR